MDDRCSTPDGLPSSARTDRSVPVLCHEEAMVYLENYLRGSRNEDDLRALAAYLVDLPRGNRPRLPVDTARLLHDIGRILEAM